VRTFSFLPNVRFWRDEYVKDIRRQPGFPSSCNLYSVLRFIDFWVVFRFTVLQYCLNMSFTNMIQETIYFKLHKKTLRVVLYWLLEASHFSYSHSLFIQSSILLRIIIISPSISHPSIYQLRNPSSLVNLNLTRNILCVLVQWTFWVRSQVLNIPPY